MRRAIFLDRDGTLNSLMFYPDTGEFESPRTPADLRLLPGVVEALSTLQAGGWLLFLVSNQPSYAKGKTSLENLHAVHDRLEGWLSEQLVILQAAYYCYHHPNGIIPEYTGPCECRKPASGALLKAKVEYDLDLPRCWMVGDQDTDVWCGQNAGCQTILFEYEPSRPKRGASQPTYRCADLAEAVSVIQRASTAKDLASD